MKVNTILSLVVATLASKVAAECFATKLGSPCCTQTTDVVFTDENGEWGIENGVKCGIEETELPISYLEKRSIDWSDYMDKIKITEFCPKELTVRHESVKYPTMDNSTYYSTTTKSERPLIVLLPPNYDPSKKYPVLYFLHGVMTDGAFMLQEHFGTIAIPGNLFHQHKAKEMLMVFPNQYAPVPGTEVEPGFTQEFFAGYDNFINELVNDIMPYMEKKYPILTGRENTAICGYSFGGRNSLYIGYKRSDLFGYIGGFSPAPGVTPGDDFSGHHKGLFQEDEFRAEIQPIVSMLSCGSNDTTVFDFPKSYHQILTKNHQKHIWYEIPGYDHMDDESFTSALYNFLPSVFGNLNEEPATEQKGKNKKIVTKKVKVVKTKKAKVTKNVVKTKQVKKTKKVTKSVKN